MSHPLRTLSFIIPAFNEAEHIARTVRSVFQAVPAEQLADVIVCDHGSTDGTTAIARAEGAAVHTWTDGTIAAQRNRGAALATGDVLVFLDADTALSAEWADALPTLFERLTDDPTLLTGSHPTPPSPGTWLERHWFAQISAVDHARHLGSAHLVMTRAHFEAIGGFDATLVTGEDFELCTRAVTHGSTIEVNHALVAVHHDFPKSLAAFVAREAWHGRGNFASVEMALSSPVSVATIGFAALHGVALASLRRRRVPVVAMTGIAGLCVASSLYKFRRAPKSTQAINAGVFYFYYLGRSAALTRAVAEAVSDVAGEAAVEAMNDAVSDTLGTPARELIDAVAKVAAQASTPD